MFRVLPFVRFVFAVFTTAVVIAVWFFTKEMFFVVGAAVFSVWSGFYLRGFCISVAGDKLVRTGGSIFQRKTVYMLKTLCIFSVVKIHPMLPALIRITYPGQRVFIIGLSGRQAAMLEEIIQKN